MHKMCNRSSHMDGENTKACFMEEKIVKIFIVVAIVLFVISVGIVHGQSVSELVLEYEKANEYLVSMLRWISTSTTFERSDWNSLMGLIDDQKNAFYRVFAINSDELEPYKDRLDECHIEFRQAYNNFIDWVNENSDLIPKNARTIAEIIADSL